MVEPSDEMVLTVTDKDGNEFKITLAQLRAYFGGWVREDF